MFCYGERQSEFDALEKLEGVTLVEGLHEDLCERFEGEPGILVLDDLMVESLKNPEVEKLFTRGTHHRKWHPPPHSVVDTEHVSQGIANAESERALRSGFQEPKRCL